MTNAIAPIHLPQWLTALPVPPSMWDFLDRHAIAIVAVVTFLLTVAFLLYNKWRAERQEYSLTKGDLNLDDLFGTSKDSLPCGGSTDKYDWSQTEEEVEMYVKVPANTQAKQVECTITSKTLTLVVQEKTLIDGELFKHVLADDCSWQMEGDGEQRRVWITLFKRAKTERKHHWKTVIKGDPEIDTESFGPPVRTIDSSDPNSMREAARTVRDMQ